MEKSMLKRYSLYLLRWQLSTPILWLVISFLSLENYLVKTVIANLIGGIIFFWLDGLIFRVKGKDSGRED